MSKLVVDMKEETITVNYESAGYVAILNHAYDLEEEGCE